MGLPEGIPCLHLVISPVCTGICNMCTRIKTWRDVVFSNESKFCLHQLDLRIKVWKRFRQRYENTVLIAVGGSVIVWCSISLTGKSSACHHWRSFQCREISRWDSSTSGSPISPKTGPNSSLKKTILTSTEWVLLTFGSGKDVVAWLQSRPQFQWTLVRFAWESCSCQSDQHNHTGWLATSAG